MPTQVHRDQQAYFRRMKRRANRHRVAMDSHGLHVAMEAADAERKAVYERMITELLRAMDQTDAAMEIAGSAYELTHCTSRE